MKKMLISSLTLSIFFFLLLGFVYPFAVTFLGNFMFSSQAKGSLIEVNHQVIGSALIGQSFTQKKYFHSRPSYAGNGYDATNSGASNLSATNKKLYDNISLNIQKILDENPGFKREDIPIELVTGSASGLDPHISLQGANIQIARVAKARNIKEIDLKKLVNESVEGKFLGIFGEEKINVLKLNAALDAVFK